ncbi:peptidoglycan DD-metalloendopeptidase family protein [Albimonas sp. CAU 1670]|uniref:peptidoglycan DD-metalloendopeptidase family protein n=1 Tax=Albimonas sp. CAU 1670 TaxID=3032599 RepID=UPI0023DA4171|nr:peptidoglycan DD-metalloendopeptidase family protein [Albimonas sp. CAU 1670]MDF2231871.1 peptidoglycan DD-metalloendopeptidase family protein [Albimonas sp. CAU 1670]
MTQSIFFAAPRPETEARSGAEARRARAFPLLIAASALALAACSDGSGGGAERAAPAAPAPAAPAPTAAPLPANPTTPDSRGVIVYQDYSAVVARRGDTVQAMALRVGVSPAELAAYNGLPTSYIPSPGDELVLPPRAGGYASAGGSAAEAPQALSAAPSAPSGPAPAAAVTSASAASVETTTAAGGWSPSMVEGALQRSNAPADVSSGSPRLGTGAGSGGGGSDVGYHDVADGETIYSIARQYGVTPESLISWNALSGPDYRVTAGQVLVIPAAGSAAGSTAAPLYPPGGEGVATPPPSSGAPLPADTQQARPLPSPNLSQYQSPPPAPTPAPAAAPAAAPAISAPVEAAPQPASVERAAPAPTASVAPGKLLRPVPGRIVSGFNRSGSGKRNDGVDFAATPGEAVSAAAAGTVALVSRSLGEWGNIVLVRHTDEMMTVYSRLGDISVTKGETVAAGQRIGAVGQPDSGAATLHFEVRKGAFSENPETYF